MSNAKKTVLITGASSGIGLETALYFFERGWNVIATMRHPDKRRTLLHEKGLPDLLHLDVTDKGSIQATIQYALGKYQGIDVLVNNAGYAVYGPFEATTPAQVAKQFDTNLFGMMEVTREFLPQFRNQRGGTIINLSSVGGRLGFPLYSVYNSTKWAIEGFSEALQYELKPLNISVKVVEPGIIKTDFYERSMEKADCSGMMDAYGDILERGQEYMQETSKRTGIEPQAVAQAIYRAATDKSRRLRYPIGPDAVQASILRRLLPEAVFFKILERVSLK